MDLTTLSHRPAFAAGSMVASSSCSMPSSSMPCRSRGPHAVLRSVDSLHPRKGVVETYQSSCIEVSDTKALRERIKVDLAGLVARYGDAPTRVEERRETQFV